MALKRPAWQQQQFALCPVLSAVRNHHRACVCVCARVYMCMRGGVDTCIMLNHRRVCERDGCMEGVDKCTVLNHRRAYVREREGRGRGGDKCTAWQQRCDHVVHLGLSRPFGHVRVLDKCLARRQHCARPSLYACACGGHVPCVTLELL